MRGEVLEIDFRYAKIARQCERESESVYIEGYPNSNRSEKTGGLSYLSVINTIRELLMDGVVIDNDEDVYDYLVVNTGLLPHLISIEQDIRKNFVDPQIILTYSSKDDPFLLFLIRQNEYSVEFSEKIYDFGMKWNNSLDKTKGCVIIMTDYHPLENADEL